MEIRSGAVHSTLLTKGMKAVASAGVVMPASAIQQCANRGSVSDVQRARGVLAPLGVGEPTRDRTPAGIAEGVGAEKPWGTWVAGSCARARYVASRMRSAAGMWPTDWLGSAPCWLGWLKKWS